MRKFIVAALSALVGGAGGAGGAIAAPVITPFENVQWGLLNPARGDNSPGAADLWGNRTMDVATGMLVRFNPGFKSPPHIHNITYRGIVIDGLVHNDVVDAPKNWLPATSYWLQPAGQEHTTAADAEYNMAYIEIDSGPYLVEDIADAFDNGERPITARPENMNWIDMGGGLQSVALWGANAVGTPHGQMIKFPAGFNGTLSAIGDQFHIVVISGAIQSGAYTLPSGSYIGNSGAFEMPVSTMGESIIYIRTDGRFDISI